MGAEILIVDDDPIAAEMTAHVLLAAGYTSATLNQGNKLLEEIQAQRPRLVVMDILMPGIDGLTLCKRVKQDPATKATRIVVVSGKSMQTEKYRALKAGADAFIAKPYDIAHFAEVIASLIGPPAAGGPAPTA